MAVSSSARRSFNVAISLGFPFISLLLHEDCWTVCLFIINEKTGNATDNVGSRRKSPNLAPHGMMFALTSSDHYQTCGRCHGQSENPDRGRQQFQPEVLRQLHLG